MRICKKKMFTVIGIVCFAFSLNSCSSPTSPTKTNDEQPQTKQTEKIRNQPLTFPEGRIIASNVGNIVAIKSDGTVINTPVKLYATDSGDEVDLGWSNIWDIDCGGGNEGVYVTLAVESNGTVVGSSEWFNAPSMNVLYSVSDWDNIVSVSAGNGHSYMGLKNDGSVVVVPKQSEKYVASWHDIVSIASGEDWACFIGVQKNGRVVTGGPYEEENQYNQSECKNWMDMIKVDAGVGHIIGLKYDGTVKATGNNDYGQCNVSSWRDIVAISAGRNNTAGLRKDGTVVVVGDNQYGQCNVSKWKDIIAVKTDGYQTIGIKNDGTVVIEGRITDAAKIANKWPSLRVE